MTPDRRMTVTVAIACVLTSTAMYPLFDSSQWFYTGIGAVLAVAVCGMLSRLRSLPVVACLAISSNGISGSHSSHMGSASPRIWSACTAAHIWMSPSG